MNKRIFDILTVTLAAPFLLPVALLVALLVRLRLGSPILFIQPRPGFQGRTFRMIKFRTMTDVRDSEGRLLPDAERLTPLGRFLRASSLDELPEFINVLKGEMSLVGPRPLLLDYMPLYSAQQKRRHEVRPGITGLAQVNGRNSLDWDEKFALDVWYVENRSMWLDLRILGRTVSKVLRRDGISAAGAATMPPFKGDGERCKR